MNAQQLIAKLRTHSLTLGTVESCTGGLLSAHITAISGCSDVFIGGVIAYSNQLKTQLVQVPEDMIKNFGAVSQNVAIAMAQGGASKLGVQICVAITGLAGPNGGSAHKPVGRVHIAVASINGRYLHHQFDFGDQHRIKIQKLSAQNAILMINQFIDNEHGTNSIVN